MEKCIFSGFLPFFRLFFNFFQKKFFGPKNFFFKKCQFFKKKRKNDEKNDFEGSPTPKNSFFEKKIFWEKNIFGPKMTKMDAKWPKMVHFSRKIDFVPKKTILRGPNLRKTPFVGTREIKLHMHLLRKYLITLGQIWIFWASSLRSSAQKIQIWPRG